MTDHATPYVPGEPTDDEVLKEFEPVVEQPSRTRRWMKIFLGTLAVVAVLFVFSQITNGSSAAHNIITPPLVKAQQACDPTGLGTTVADGKKTLVVNGAGKEDATGVPVEAEACILNKLGATTAVLQHMDSTRALDGRQTDTWDGFKAAWTYHPDQGLDLLIQES